ncbi:Asp-tRNAAsn/Glu-tRNAGln amidotransferase B subunit [Wallemia mellicola]|uniref:Glutamyl-tRNA(Gln) amidotransferase subunit B, mitochondrial n=1 Tax=Wallemia mellicola TaxID=1708541 RepID=A0AB38MU20_9BASI|nr:Asp-tRNAAsn/Glu-tRNAGln amidotransferase B subunit [Wallemia mellicola]
MQISRILQNIPKKIKSKPKKSSWLEEYNLIIGLEIHAQLNASIKLFSTNESIDSRVTNDFSKPNTSVSSFDASIPGTLPILNKEPYWKAIKASLALDCAVSPTSSFDRKHYSYYDLPQGYQITQQYNPLAKDGFIQFNANLDDNITRDFKVRLSRIQLEQDTGKAYFHESSKTPLVDLNRCGVALIEIVTKPDMTSPIEAVSFVKKLRSILRSIDVCNGNMEEGNLRADVNVNVQKKDNLALKTPRVEIKNLNSLKSMTAAINYEYERHARAIQNGRLEDIQQDTLGWNVTDGQTFKMRSKEDAIDYRYMPDPNLRPVSVTEKELDEVRSKIEILPDQIRQRIISQYGLSARDVNVLLTVNEDLSGDESIINYFERLAQVSKHPQLAVNWVIHELLGQLSQRHKSFKEDIITVERLNELISLIEANQVTSTAAKKVFSEMFDDTESSASNILDRLDLRVLDGDKLEKVVNQAIEELPDESNKARQGNEKVLRRIIGQVMKLAGGKADGSEVERALRQKLSL